MLQSLAMILLIGLLLSSIFQKLKLPSFLGMLITGILLGSFHLLDKNLLMISGDLREIALIIILTRAGLSLDINVMKKVGRPAILMCFVPAAFEILGVTIFAPIFLGISHVEAAIMGSVLGAVSPAVIVPRMLKLMDEGLGTKKGIPQLLIAGASVDDVFVIVMFTSFLSLAKGGHIKIMDFAMIPVSIILGIAVGIMLGYLLVSFTKRVHIRDSIKVIIILGLSFALVSLEKVIPISGLIAVISMNATIFSKQQEVAKRLSGKFSKLWLGAEILLFVLVGASVNISYTLQAGLGVIALLFCELVFRTIGVMLCLVKTNINKKERLFCMVSYLPKATVQAAIGGVPLAMGLACGNIVLTVAVVAILITAPLGAFLIDKLHKKLLTTE